MYLRYAEKKKWRVEVMSESKTLVGGIKEVIVNEEVILRHETPLIVYHKESAESA